ncbi:MAG: hypothetical protein RBS39_08450 [Phycisphaerales bacterium]|jgi:PBP1b-binding outer membrane lipoprotein LpoB|nr:hypothetical protein [Phycisphaerales bacterium]
MPTICRVSALALAALPLTLAACDSGYKPREQAAGTEITTHGLNVQEVERVAADLAESLLQSGRFASTDDPAMVAVSKFVNNTTQTNIDRDRVTNRIFMVLVNSGRAEAYTPDDLNTEAFAGRTKNRRVYTLNAKISEDEVRQDRDKQVSYIFQMQLTEWRGDARPQVWIDERRITTESRR